MNSFLHPVSELHFDRYRPEDVAEALDITEASTWKKIDVAVGLSDSERTYDNTVLAISRASEEFDLVVGVTYHLQSVLGEPWREAGDMVVERDSALRNKISFHKGIYDALIAARSSIEPTSLSAPRKKLLDELILSFERDGIALPEAEQNELMELRAKLSKAQHDFGENVVRATDALGLHVTTEEELAGLSQDFIETCAKDAQDKGLEGYWIDYTPPSYVYVMSSCSHDGTRRELYRLSHTRAVDTNAPIAVEVLKLRRQIAAKLGYADWADYVLERRMAKTGATATAFIEDLVERYKPKMEEEFTALQTFVDELPDAHGYKLDASDFDSGLDFYYSNKLRARDVGIDEEELKAYFSLDRVLTEMFTTLTTLYGIDFKRVEPPVWQDDVEVYELHDGDHHIATVWCDWYAKKGKRGGAWANVFYVADRSHGSFDKPHLGTVVANFDPPANGRSRLTLRDVETIWHEFGHFVHFAVGTTELEEQSSFACRWDFVEAPSQIMENWVWQPEVMVRLAQHESTGAGLDQAVMDKLLAGRVFEVGRKAMRQLNFALSDLRLHRDYDPTRDGDINAYVRTITADLLPVAPYEDDAAVMTFTHIFDGGYSAAYYSYKWAEVIEADFFGRFKAEGPLNPAVGRAYRTNVLARGSEVEPDELIQAFLGRRATPEAMLRRDGVES